MIPIRRSLTAFLASLAVTAGLSAQQRAISYAVTFPDRAAHQAIVTARIPTGGLEAVELMMPVWSPGYYKVENYADRVHDVVAGTPTRAPLDVTRSGRNRWRIASRGAQEVIVTYRVIADTRFVTADWVGDSLIVLNGAPTFMTLADTLRRPAEVRLELPTGWRSATALDTIRDGISDHYRADDYDELVDSPIIAGDLRVRGFRSGGSEHAMVDVGDVAAWDSDRAAGDIARIVDEHRRFWGALPYERYVFLNMLRPGGGGLEHGTSTLLTTNARRASTPRGYAGWLSFVSHEYFHAMNVKRLRPIELGPFDYERGPRTPSLWISEGLTTYFGDLLVARSGLASPAVFLERMSALIGQLQNTPGRLVQTLSASSLDVWNSENSAVGMDRATTVSYYTKGPVVGLLLDARIRRATNGARSLDDVMRLAYARYSGARGFTPEEFRSVTSEVAGEDLSGWLRRALDTVEELEYGETLEWYGLRFAASAGNEQTWRLEVRPDATVEQRARLAALTAH